MEEYSQALLLYESVVGLAEEVLGFDHPNTKVFQGNLRSLREKLEIES
jgi:hypothetical protein